MSAPGARCLFGDLWAESFGLGLQACVYLRRKARPGIQPTFSVLLGPTTARDLAAKCLQLRAELLGQTGDFSSRRGIALEQPKVIKNTTELQLQHRSETNHVMVSINGRSAFLLNDWELSALAGGLFALFDELGQSEASPLAQLEEVA